MIKVYYAAATLAINISQLNIEMVRILKILSGRVKYDEFIRISLISLVQNELKISTTRIKSTQQENKPKLIYVKRLSPNKQ